MMACSPKVATLSNTDVERANIKYPGTTLAMLKEGSDLNKQYCQSCHPMKSPTSRTEAEWEMIVPKMVVKVNKKAGSDVLDASKQQTILRFLITMSSAPKPSN